MECSKPKPKHLPKPITTGANNPMNQSELSMYIETGTGKSARSALLGREKGANFSLNYSGKERKAKSKQTGITFDT